MYNRFVLASLIARVRPLLSSSALGTVSKAGQLGAHIAPVRALTSAALPSSTLSSSVLSAAPRYHLILQREPLPSSSTGGNHFRAFSSAADPSPTGGHGNYRPNDDVEDAPPRYSWIDDEAHELIKKAYERHKSLADKSQSFPPSLSITDLERIGKPYHFRPTDFIDRLALNLMKVLRVFVHGFFREKYDHHAVCLETVAAVPGLVGSFHRHLRSLRRMQRDHGWINVLQEEAENERMHLLIFMKVCQPSGLERALVVAAQGLYLTFYSGLYLVNSRAAHRLTGYLEEEAHRAYTDYLASIDSGKIENKPAPAIARTYYRLPENATLRDVILHVRADEAMHRDVNHQFGNMYANKKTDHPLHGGPVDRT